MKQCFKCLTEYPIDCFHKHKQMKDGHLNKCKYCVKLDVDNWRKQNTDCRKKEYEKRQKKLGKKTREQWKLDVAKNAIGKKARSNKYAHKRRLQIKTSAQTEFDLFVELEAYHLIQIREQLLKSKWSLDHIVPINHKNACGLHVAYNFQVVPAKWNYAKGNRNMNTFYAYTGY